MRSYSLLTHGPSGGCFRGKADLKWQAKSAVSFENDPRRSSGHLEFYQVSDRWETDRKGTEPLPGSLVAVTSQPIMRASLRVTEAGAVTSPGHEVLVVATERIRRRC